jgi:UrcA family protein
VVAIISVHLVGAALPAGAGQAMARAEVAYVNADLARPDSAQKLYERISRAARSVCTALRRPELRQRHAYRECVQQAIDAAVADVNHPALSAVHAAHLGKSSLTAANH